MLEPLSKRSPDGAPGERDPLVGLAIGLPGGSSATLVERIAQGVFTSVYRASGSFAGSLDNQAAVKILDAPPADADALRERFAREVQIARLLDGHGVPRFLDAGDLMLPARPRSPAQRRPYLVTELLPGRPLSARIREGGRTGPAETGAIGVAILDALAPAHAMGVVHRDLKPANVMMLREPPQPVARLLDLGVARWTTGGRPPLGEALGTPAYAAPEQSAGTGDDARADLYSLGVILFELCCGRRPYRGDPVAMLRAHVEEPAPDPREFGGIPDPLAELLLRALEKDPGRRFPDAATMRAALLALRPEDR